jgi:hypothetical protein
MRQELEVDAASARIASAPGAEGLARRGIIVLQIGRALFQRDRFFESA